MPIIDDERPARDGAKPTGPPAPKASQAGLGPGGEYYKIYADDFRRLLGRALGVLDMSLPNKQQHASACRALRTAFDDAYYQAMELTHPDLAFGSAEPWAMEPLL